MYDVIRKSYCCAKSRLSRNFSYISRQGIMRPACRESLFVAQAQNVAQWRVRGNENKRTIDSRGTWEGPRTRLHAYQDLRMGVAPEQALYAPFTPPNMEVLALGWSWEAGRSARGTAGECGFLLRDLMKQTDAVSGVIRASNSSRRIGAYSRVIVAL